MLTVDDQLPRFALQAVVGLEKGKEFREITWADNVGRWLVLFFWPMDFTFVCPTEIAEFGRRYSEFRARDAEVLGCSTDSAYAHLAWRREHPDLRALPFPMLADPKRALCTALGVLHREEGVALRATFIVDPEGVIRFAAANDLQVGRSVDEVLRVLDALRTDELCGCEWRPGTPTLKAA
jgi:peroxiredoxin (alkyl hydroperoxide reductase subunit C)